MSAPILATKLYIPPPRPKVVRRPRLIEQLNDGPHRKLTLISAPAGFGKTTLIGEWVAGCDRPVAWLSLDKEDNDPARFLTYFIAALRTIAANIGVGVLGALQSPQPPPIESLLPALINEITAGPDNFTLVLDDYHVIEAKPVDDALAFLLEHQPMQMHLVVATREDPRLPLARLRAQGQLIEVRVADLRFTPAEAAGFLNQAIGLSLSEQDIAALEARTEGWIAGLQLAAISMRGHKDTTGFIKSFTGSHHFVMDYLVEEVLQQQPERVQTFLLRTSILDRMCGSLCDAVLADSPASGQETLEYLEHANLFIVPLDNERRWYRYHHLFADLLRQRLGQSSTCTSSVEENGRAVAELHIRASQWYEANGFEIEAFHHAAAANDVDHAERLIEGKGMPLHFRGAINTVLNWLESLPTTMMDARPSLWVTYASALSMTGQTTAVEEKLQSAEKFLQEDDPDKKIRNLIGHIAAIRALLALSQRQVDTIITQSQRALEYLHPDNLPVRTATIWKLGLAYQLQGDRTAAGRAYMEAIAISQASGNVVINASANLGLGVVQESENQLYLATESYRSALQQADGAPPPVVCEAYLGQARISYEWNDLDVAEQQAQQSLQLALRLKNTDRFVFCDVFLARLKLAQGDVDGAAAILAQADQSAQRHNFVYRLPEIASAQVLILLHQGNLEAAARLVEKYEIPISRAQVYLAREETSAALAVLAPLRRQMEEKGWADNLLKVTVLQAVTCHAHGEKDKAVQLLGDALVLAEPGGFIRTFVDEGPPMAQLLSDAAARGIKPDYICKLLAALEVEERQRQDKSDLPNAQPHIELLSQRELEVLQLIVQGLSNREIGRRLFLALDTIKGHNRRIYEKLQVQRRTEAIARARELGLL